MKKIESFQSQPSKGKPLPKERGVTTEGQIVNISSKGRPLCKEREAAAYLGVAVSWLQKARSKGLKHNGKFDDPSNYGPPYIKMGKSVFYDPDDLDEWKSCLRRVNCHAQNVVVGH